jgi:hypothetical protein
VYLYVTERIVSLTRENEMHVEILVPIALFAGITIVLALLMYYRHRTRAEVQQTLRALVERGGELSPELLERIGEPPRPKNADLRRGIIALGLGLGIAAFGVVLGEEDAVQPLLAISALPLLIGLAYLGLWKFGGDKE